VYNIYIYIYIHAEGVHKVSFNLQKDFDLFFSEIHLTVGIYIQGTQVYKMLVRTSHLTNKVQLRPEFDKNIANE